MRLAALVDSPDHVCARYRLRAFESHLVAAGHTLQLHALPHSWWDRLTLARLVRDADVVILQRKLLSRPELSLLTRRVRRLWFDFDDAVWMRDSYATKGFASSKREAAIPVHGPSGRDCHCRECVPGRLCATCRGTQNLDCPDLRGCQSIPDRSTPPERDRSRLGWLVQHPAWPGRSDGSSQYPWQRGAGDSSEARLRPIHPSVRHGSD